MVPKHEMVFSGPAKLFKRMKNVTPKCKIIKLSEAPVRIPQK